MTTLPVRIVPNAKANQVICAHGAAIKIKLRAPAVEGKANAALRSFLAEELKIPEGNTADRTCRSNCAAAHCCTVGVTYVPRFCVIGFVDAAVVAEEDARRRLLVLTRY